MDSEDIQQSTEAELTYSATKTGDRSILPADMISVEEARAQILSTMSPLNTVDCSLEQSLGLVLAEDIYSDLDIPPHPNTGMDGYAVRAEDTKNASYSEPTNLTVIGYLPAGAVFEGIVSHGQAVRIMTGAPMPDGADAVVPFEETDEYDWDTRESARLAGDWDQNPKNNVRIDVEAKPGANIRLAGEDIQEGVLVLRKGTVVGAPEIGVLASLGVNSVKCIRRPVVAILSTGDELVRPGESLAPGQIYDANSYSLAAQVTAFGGEALVLDVSKDTIEALTLNINKGLKEADLLVTSAGVSRGDFDVVKTVLAQQGEIGFWTVRMKPGKPLAFGVLEDSEGKQVPHLGLPGNPVSAMMTFELFGRPAIFKLAGRLITNVDAWERPRVTAIAGDRLKNTDGRRFYARCLLEKEPEGVIARLTGSQGSGVLTSMMLADGYAVCPEDKDSIEIGEEVEVIVVR